MKGSSLYLFNWGLCINWQEAEQCVNDRSHPTLLGIMGVKKTPRTHVHNIEAAKIDNANKV